MSAAKTHLSAIQSRILVALFQSDGRQQFVPNEMVLERTGIAQSTWSEEQKRLMDMGLLEKKAFKTIRTNNVCRIVNFRLTGKGRTVAFNLANISRIIFQGQQNSDASIPNSTLSPSALEFEIIESIEVALDSFGINLIPLVKSKLPEGVTWQNVARNPEILTTVLRDLFGKDGAATVESMIVENVKSRLEGGWDNNSTSEDLTRLVGELQRKFIVTASVMEFGK
jgi:DNA-binding MarR family transcriptional regulator